MSQGLRRCLPRWSTLPTSGEVQVESLPPLIAGLYDQRPIVGVDPPLLANGNSFGSATFILAPQLFPGHCRLLSVAEEKMVLPIQLLKPPPLAMIVLAGQT